MLFQACCTTLNQKVQFHSTRFVADNQHRNLTTFGPLPTKRRNEVVFRNHFKTASIQSNNCIIGVFGCRRLFFYSLFDKQTCTRKCHSRHVWICMHVHDHFHKSWKTYTLFGDPRSKWTLILQNFDLYFFLIIMQSGLFTPWSHA